MEASEFRSQTSSPHRGEQTGELIENELSRRRVLVANSGGAPSLMRLARGSVLSARRNTAGCATEALAAGLRSSCLHGA